MMSAASMNRSSSQILRSPVRSRPPAAPARTGASSRALAAILVATALLFVGACSSPYKGVPLAAPRSYAEGENALARGDYDVAAGHFSAYLSSGRKTYRARALYQLARAQYQMEDYKGAQESLGRLEKEFPGFGRKQVTAMHGDLAYALGNRVDAILLWESAYVRSTADEREVLRPRITEAIRFLDADEAAELAALLTNPQIYDMALGRLDVPGNALAALDQGQRDSLAGEIDDMPPALIANDGILPALTTDEDIAAADGRDAGIGWKESIEPEAPAPVEAGLGELGDEDVVAPAVVAAIAEESLNEASPARSSYYVGPRVAALLPLTGSGRAEGGRALAALRRSIDASTLVVRDTGSDPVIAVEILQQLAADRDVVALLGPMLPAEIDAVRDAHNTDLPILPLVDRPRVVPATEPTAALATHAVQTLRVSRIGILTPSLEHASAFTSAAAALGATIVGTHLYDASDMNEDGIIAVVQSWTDAGGADAVYVPDQAPRALRVAAAARAVAPRLVLLGDAGWNDVAALATAGRAVEGAIIIGAAAPSGDVEDTVVRVAAALQRAVALGESSRLQTKALLAGFADGKPGPVLLQVVDGRSQPIR